jgi:hypothetical protein
VCWRWLAAYSACIPRPSRPGQGRGWGRSWQQAQNSGNWSYRRVGRDGGGREMRDDAMGRLMGGCTAP